MPDHRSDLHSADQLPHRHYLQICEAIEAAKRCAHDAVAVTDDKEKPVAVMLSVDAYEDLVAMARDGKKGERLYEVEEVLTILK